MSEVNVEKTPEENTPTPKPAMTIPDDTSAFALAERAAWHLMEKLGLDLTVIDLRGRSDVCEFYVICTGQSSNQISALAKHVHTQLAGAGHKPNGLEGMTDGRWALLDFFDVVIHIFKSDARDYYNLERLWGDAPQLEIAPAHFEAASVAARHSDLNFNLPVGNPDSAV
ncbi:MAG: ribosome-associated protein [Candidatus Krumholzibacteriia bacterium]|jgi:ribosome-associated protein